MTCLRPPATRPAFALAVGFAIGRTVVVPSIVNHSSAPVIILPQERCMDSRRNHGTCKTLVGGARSGVRNALSQSQAAAALVSMSGEWKRSMAEMVGHARPKVRATGETNFGLTRRATPRLYRPVPSHATLARPQPEGYRRTADSAEAVNERGSPGLRRGTLAAYTLGPRREGVTVGHAGLHRAWPRPLARETLP